MWSRLYFVVIVHIYAVMTTSSSSLIFSNDILVAYQNINSFVQKAQEMQYFLYLITFYIPFGHQIVVIFFIF